MEISIKQNNSIITTNTLYQLLKESKYQIGLFYSLSEDDFNLILLNGITFIAFIEEEVMGFINFEILSNGSHKYCVHNITYVKPNTFQEEICEKLYYKEKEYLKKIGDVNYITTKVYIQDKRTQLQLTKQGFTKRITNRYTFKNIKYIGIEYVYPKNVVNNQTLKIKVIVFIKNRLCYNTNGENTWMLNLYNYAKKKKSIFLSLKSQQKICKKIKKLNQAKILFFASSLAMWKYQYLYELLIKDNRFKVYIVISPFPNYSLEQQKLEVHKLQIYFENHNMKYMNFEFNGAIFDIKKHINPDIIFYPQPYFDQLYTLHNPSSFQDKLIAYYPYGYYIENEQCYYNNLFQEIAWKLFYSNQTQKDHAMKFALNKGKNVSIVGYPLADNFRLHTPVDCWKKQCHEKYKIIWAPHFSINSNTSVTNHSNFLHMANYMLDIAKEYNDKIQIAFKPHPRLKTELYNNQFWGKKRTDNYYSQWENLENGQLELGDFIDLFLTSDAMIHDSTSFCVDYLYTYKPVMYISNDIEQYKKNLDNIGKKVLDMHYIGRSQNDVTSFIKNIVLAQQDWKKKERTSFVNDYLLPPNGKSTAQNTFDEIVRCLFK